MEQLLRSVLAGSQIEKVRVLIDELCVHGASQELVIAKHVLQEGNVGLQKEEEETGIRGDPGQANEREGKPEPKRLDLQAA